jgi:hypothetical protein
VIAYAVRVELALGGSMFEAEVDGPGGVRGIGYADDERNAIENAWRDFWSSSEPPQENTSGGGDR